MLKILKQRFDEHKSRFENLDWQEIQQRLEENPTALKALEWMEATKGEPALLGYDESKDRYIFTDFSKASPKGRVKVCYDQQARESRKKFPPETSAMELAQEYQVELLDEATYRQLQAITPVDLKTSSWLKTPEKIRDLGGAIFGDNHYECVFIYHNGADSYYSNRAFRVKVEL